MKIDLTELKRFHWFEDDEGNIYDGISPNLPKDIDRFIYKVVEPCKYSERLTIYTYHPEFLHENNQFYHAMLQFRWFYNFMYKRMKKRGDSMTFKDVATFNTTFNCGRDCIVAMVNSGDYKLDEAIYIYTHACERCMNVLEYKYSNGKEGYAEYSEEWKKCNTECDFCKDEVKK